MIIIRNTSIKSQNDEKIQIFNFQIKKMHLYYASQRLVLSSMLYIRSISFLYLGKIDIGEIQNRSKAIILLI